MSNAMRWLAAASGDGVPQFCRLHVFPGQRGPSGAAAANLRAAFSRWGLVCTSGQYAYAWPYLVQCIDEISINVLLEVVLSGSKLQLGGMIVFPPWLCTTVYKQLEALRGS